MISRNIIQEQLQATKLDAYLDTLADLPEQQDVLDDFVQQQADAWDAVIEDFGLTEVNQDTFFAEIKYRVKVLNKVVCDVTKSPNVATKEGWQQLISLLKRYLPADRTNGFFLKPSVVAQFLTLHPPTNLLNHLGYDSIEDCLAAESVYEIMSALRFSESEEWMKTYLESYRQLDETDFEYRAVKFIMLDPKKWWSLAKPFAKKKKHFFSHLKEFGVVFSYPGPEQASNNDNLQLFLLMILHYVYEVDFYSDFFQYNVNRIENFGETFVEILKGDRGMCSTDPNELPIIQQYHLKKPNPNECVFQPHVMPEVLHWHKARKKLFEILNKHEDYKLLSFWETCYNVGRVVNGELYTLNFADNVLSDKELLTYHYKEDLWNSLFNNYFSEDHLEEAIIHYFPLKKINLKELIDKYYG
ncbi:MAG: hypothetical protein Q8P90_02445 [bacterium]|nr:hypothetical protein [bacterium]